MIQNNKYGYKIMYKEKGKKLKIHLVTNSFYGALWDIKYYIRNPQFNRKTKKLIINPKWYLYPVKDLEEYEKLWKGCPFKDDLS